MSVFVTATDERLCALVNAAQKRLFVMAPAISERMAGALCKRIEGAPPLPCLDVVVDPDPEVYRLGYGDVKSLDLLRAALPKRKNFLKEEQGVRICLIVSDSTFLVYAPTPRLIEAQPGEDEKKSEAQDKNALIIPPQAEAIADAVGITARSAELIENPAVPGVVTTVQEVGNDAVTDAQVHEMKRDLEEQPPKPFDLARQERVFCSKLEYVEFKVFDLKLSDRVITLPPEVSRITDKDVKSRVKNTLSLFGDRASEPTFHIPEGRKSFSGQTWYELSEKRIRDELKELEKAFCYDLGEGYGKVILLKNKKAFQEGLDLIGRHIKIFQDRIKTDLKSYKAKTLDALFRDLWPYYQKALPDELDDIFHRTKGSLTEAFIRGHLEDLVGGAIDRMLTFRHSDIHPVYKSVTSADIHCQTDFAARLRKYISQQEFDSLFPEHTAAPEVQRPA